MPLYNEYGTIILVIISASMLFPDSLLTNRKLSVTEERQLVQSTKFRGHSPEDLPDSSTRFKVYVGV